MRFVHKRVLITGASQGIGRAIAVHVARGGAEVWLAARNETGLTETVARILDAGGTAHSVPCDLRNPHSVQDLARAAAPVDLLIHNAADVTSKPLQETTLDEIESLIRTNVIGPLQLTRLLLPEMQGREGAAIVFVSSLAGYKPNPSQMVYSISKRAVNGMADAVRAEVRGSGMHVLNVALGSVAVGGAPVRGQVTVEQFLKRLDRALDQRVPELYMSPVSKWLMRLYAAVPRLMR